MDAILNTLRKTKHIGYGIFEISVEINDVTYKIKTNNTMAIDAAFDDDYNDENNLGRYYVTQEEAQASLANDIILEHDLDMELI
jgi:hypothetical protein